MQTKPPVGLYHPQDKIITKRPKTHEFSRIGKFNTAGLQKPLPEPVTVPRAFEEQLRRIKNEKLTNMKRQLMLQHEATINSEGVESPQKNGNSQLKNSQRSQKLSMNEIGGMYRTQRYCNTVKVYKKFCKQANIPANWSIRNSVDNNSKLSEDQNPVKQKVKTVNFSKQLDRKEFSEGYFSANESRFKKTHSTMISDKQQQSINFDKYSSRDQKSCTGLPFQVQMQGIFYDVDDSYKTTQLSSSSYSFKPHTDVWRSAQQKKDFVMYKMTKKQMEVINFDNIKSKLKSVKPKTGNALKRQISKEDDTLFRLFIGQLNKKDTFNAGNQFIKLKL